MKIGLVQLLVEGGEPERNFERAATYTREAVKLGAEIVVLPETIDFAWTHPSSLSLALPIPGAHSQFFCELAKDCGAYLLVGLTEKDGDAHYNSAVFINKQGEIIHKYRKINLLEVEFPFYKVGQSLSVIDTPWGKIGVNICADNYCDSLHIGHSLARMGAQIILSPSSWTVDYSITEEDDPYLEKWVKPLSILASYHELIMVSTTSVGYIVGGPYEGKKMVGRSLVMGPQGVIAEGSMNEFASDLIVVDVTLQQRKFKGCEIGKSLSRQGYTFDHEPISRL